MSHDRILHALADTTRRSILDRLRRRPHTVGELAAHVPVTQPAVSQHLKVLRQAGLVSVEKDGVRRIYHFSVEGLEPLRAYIASFWEEALEAFGRSFETERRVEEEP
jgi:DNA-binding transcriptional ArsR family regulator